MIEEGERKERRGRRKVQSIEQRDFVGVIGGFPATGRNKIEIIKRKKSLFEILKHTFLCGCLCSLKHV